MGGFFPGLPPELLSGQSSESTRTRTEKSGNDELIRTLIERIQGMQPPEVEVATPERTPVRTIGAALSDALFQLGRGINQAPTDFSGQLQQSKERQAAQKTDASKEKARMTTQQQVAAMQAELQAAISGRDIKSREQISEREMQNARELAQIQGRNRLDEIGLTADEQRITLAQSAGYDAEQALLDREAQRDNLLAGHINSKEIEGIRARNQRSITNLEGQIRKDITGMDIEGRKDLSILQGKLDEVARGDIFEKDKVLKGLEADLRERGDEKSQRLADELSTARTLVEFDLQKKLSTFEHELRDKESVTEYAREVALRGAELGLDNKFFSELSTGDQIQAIAEAQYQRNRKELGEQRASGIESEYDQGHLAGRQLLNAYIDGDIQSGLPSLKKRLNDGEDPMAIISEFKRRGAEFRMRDVDVNRYIAEMIGTMEKESSTMANPPFLPSGTVLSNLYHWQTHKASKARIERTQKAVGDLR